MVGEDVFLPTSSSEGNIDGIGVYTLGLMAIHDGVSSDNGGASTSKGGATSHNLDDSVGYGHLMKSKLLVL